MAATMLIPLKQHTYTIEHMYTAIPDYIAENDKAYFPPIPNLGVSMSRSSEMNSSRPIGVAYLNFYTMSEMNCPIKARI